MLIDAQNLCYACIHSSLSPLLFLPPPPFMLICNWSETFGSTSSCSPNKPIVVTVILKQSLSILNNFVNLCLYPLVHLCVFIYL